MTNQNRQQRQLRTCIGCRQQKPVTELIRFQLAADKQVIPATHQAGRGAYICRTQDDNPQADPICLAQASQRRAWQRAFKSGTIRLDH